MRSDAASMHIIAERGSCGARHPNCGWLSLAVHSHYRRRPADLPVLGRTVRLELAICRYYCRNPSCPRRTFERLPLLLAPRAHLTLRLAASLGRIAGAVPGAVSGRSSLPPWNGSTGSTIGASSSRSEISLRRDRGALLCPNRRSGHGRLTQTKSPPGNPARFTLCFEESIGHGKVSGRPRSA
jgi:hypothetical protein